MALKFSKRLYTFHHSSTFAFQPMPKFVRPCLAKSQKDLEKS